MGCPICSKKMIIKQNVSSNAVLILSGGLDSTTILYKLIQEGFNVHAISFCYGQKAEKELTFAKDICKNLNVHHNIIDITNLQPIFKKSSIVDDKKQDTSIPELTVVPSRNTILLELATAYAITNNIKKVYCGVHKGDHKDYPDTTPQFIEKINELNKVNNYDYVEIVAPFLNKTKTEIVKTAIQLNVPLDKTWSCYNNHEKPCGECYSCITRQKAIQQAKQELKEV